MASNKPTVGGGNSGSVTLPAWMFGGPLPGGGLIGQPSTATNNTQYVGGGSGGLLSPQTAAAVLGGDMVRQMAGQNPLAAAKNPTLGTGGWWNNAANVTSGPGGAATQFSGPVDYSKLQPEDYFYLSRMASTLGFDPRMALSGPSADVTRMVDMYAPGAAQGNARYNPAGYGGPLRSYIDAMIKAGGGANASFYHDALKAMGYTAR